MNRVAATVLAVTLTAGTLSLTGCTDPKVACEKRGGRYVEVWKPAVGTLPARWEYDCQFPSRPLLPKPTIVTGVAGPGTVVLRFTDHGKSYLKIEQDHDRRRIVQKVPAEVYRRCKDRTRWPECAR